MARKSGRNYIRRKILIIAVKRFENLAEALAESALLIQLAKKCPGCYAPLFVLGSCSLLRDVS